MNYQTVIPDFNYTSHTRPDINNLLDFHALIKCYLQMEFDFYKL